MQPVTIRTGGVSHAGELDKCQYNHRKNSHPKKRRSIFAHCKVSKSGTPEEER